MKFLFDFLLSFALLLLFFIPIIILIIIAKFDCQGKGIYYQKRVGQNGKYFTIFKIETINQKSEKTTQIGRFLRKYKLDELPQLFNVLKGDMAFVGPRPDVIGYSDKLTGKNRYILNLKPGITGPASLKYFNEEEILSNIKNPKKYNDEVIFPDKVKINLNYYNNQSFIGDIKILLKTVLKLITK